MGTMNNQGETASQAEMEAGTEAALRTMSPLLVSQAIAALGGGGGIDTTHATITTSTTVTASDAPYIPIAMTALGQSITLPDATTLTVGAPKYYFDNASGGYPVGIRDSAGTLLMAIAAGGTAYVSCENISTAAGVWNVTGNNLEPGLITIDNTFSSTYTQTVLKPFVALDDNKSIHFLALASGFAAVAVDNTTGAVGTPVTVSAANGAPKTVFKVSTTTAIVFYSDSDAVTAKAVVVSLSGATTLAVGTSATLTGSPGLGPEYWGYENFSSVPCVAQLSSNLYLLSAAVSAPATYVVSVSVSGTTVTIGSHANIITTGSVANSTTTYALTATTGLVAYSDGVTNLHNVVIVSVSGTTCTVGTPAALGLNGALTSPPASCVLSATKVLFCANTTYAQVVTISGATVTPGAPVNIDGTSGVVLTYISSSATRYNPHLWRIDDNTAGLWFLDSNFISRAVVLSESAGTMTPGTILYRSISAAAVTAVAGGFILPQGTTEFVSLKSQSAQTGDLGLYPSKISGTTITTGAGIPARGLPPGKPSQVAFTRLSGGDYVYTPSAVSQMNTIGPAAQELLVFSSNGDVINKRGTIKAPPLIGNYEMVPAGVSATRLVMFGATTDGTTVGTETLQLRLLNVEIAQ